MSVFFKSSEAGQKLHSHIIYANPTTQVLTVSNVNGHTHEAQLQPDGQIHLLPDPYDGHEHLTVEMHEPEPKQEKSEDGEDPVRRGYALFEAGYATESKWLKAGNECEDFYAGEQWDKVDKDGLEADGKTCLTLNFIEKKVDEFVGYQRQQRTDLKFLPVEGGDQIGCDILNDLTKVVLDNSRYEQQESLVFEDEFITGRGNFDVRVDLSKDPRGDAKVERFPRDQIVYGPHEQPDASDADYLVKYQMWSMARLCATFRDKADEIRSCYSDCISINKPREGEAHLQHEVDQYAKSDNVTPMVLCGGEFIAVDVALRQMMVFELQEKLRLEGSLVFLVDMEEWVNVTDWSAKDRKQLETIPGLKLVQRVPMQRMRIVRWVGRVLLQDENPADLPTDDFHCVPVYGKKKGNRFWGKVQSLKDPQRELNKRSSQSMDIVNRMSGRGYFYDDMTFTNKADESEFKDDVSAPGFALKVANSERPPRKEEGIRVPSEVFAAADMSLARMDALAGTSPTAHAGANTSGQAIAAAEKAMLVGHERYFDNMSFAKKTIGKLLIGIYQKYYSAERIARILLNRNSNPATPVWLGGKSINDYKYEAIVRLIEQRDLSKYDVIVGESQWSPTQRVAAWNSITDMIAKGAQIPFEAALPLADMPEEVKNDMIAKIQEQQAAQSEDKQSTYNMEIRKALIGHGIIPPAVLQEQGLEGAPQQPAQPMQVPQPGGIATP